MGEASDRRAVTNPDQLVAGNTTAGPSGALESRSGTPDGKVLSTFT